LLGAAGAAGAIFTIGALRSGMLPPTLNLERPDEAFSGFDLIGPEPRARGIDYAMVNGFGFGGVNATAVLKRWSH
jgi:3-oxoacyl-[acyl-carrier-protein] synthase II